MTDVFGFIKKVIDFISSILVHGDLNNYFYNEKSLRC